MRKLKRIFIGLMFCGMIMIARAETFQLNDGRTLTGEVVPASANEAGVQVRTEDNKYERVPWPSFSQETLKEFVTDSKMERFARPFIELSPEERVQRVEINVKTDYTRLSRPEPRSLLGAMMSSSIGLLMLVLLYAAGIYAGVEVARFRSQPVPLVAGLAAIPLLGLLSPIVFLAMPTRTARSDEFAEEEVVQPKPEPAPVAPVAMPAMPRSATSSVPRTVPSSSAAPKETQKTPPTVQPAVPVPPPQVFQRGAFMFNRRFFETKFAGFTGVTRREADKDMVLLIKSLRGEFVADRIANISANDLTIQISKGEASEEILLPFTEIKEIQLKHKEA